MYKGLEPNDKDTLLLLSGFISLVSDYHCQWAMLSEWGSALKEGLSSLCLQSRSGAGPGYFFFLPFSGRAIVRGQKGKCLSYLSGRDFLCK